MATHGMIDLETLGVNPDSVLMTVGAVKFNLLVVLNLQVLVSCCDIEEQSTELGRSS